ncbi:MAG: hypothetical protein A2Y10_09890 [Planctomycetes bacterium GWF2_41_51]|nr:MAG: hypothetical protein A2Y10_09890 [Planctomycetes bacterium GWF2_41_51]HBG27432.1 hypothetical protein [Phycisphaerales bacterium]
MKKFITICLVLIAASTTYAATIQSITANNAATSFNSTTGLFSMIGSGGIVEYTSGNAYINGQFTLSMSLAADTSASGIAKGTFNSGTFSYNDGSTLLLAGSFSSFNIVESFDNFGMLAGYGNFNVTGGSLQSAFGSIGNLVNISFSVNPITISSFASDFTAISHMTVTSVPEPATIAIISLGVLSIFRKRK